MADRITQIKANVGKMIDGGASEPEIDAYLGHEGVTADQLRTHKAEESPSLGKQALRTAEFGARGVMDRVAETVGAIPDLVSEGLNKVGIPTPTGGHYTKAVKSGLDAFGRAVSAPANALLGDFGPDTPQNIVERGAYNAGGGAVDAATVVVPAAAVANRARAGSLTQRSAQVMASQPGMQAAAGATGNVVGQETGSDALGTAAAIATPVAAAVGRRAITPVPSRLTPEQQRLAAVAGQEGIPLTAAQETGSRPLRTMESVFGQLPLTAGPQAAIHDAQQVAFNRAILQRAGIRAERATPDVLDARQQQLGREFDHLAASTTVNLADQQFLRDLAAVTTRYAAKLPSQMREVFRAYVDDIQAQGNIMPGSRYQVTRSDLTRQADSYRQNDPALSTALRGLRDALDDAAGRSIPPHLRDQWDETRQQYAILQTITDAMAKTTNAASAGNITPTAFSQAVRQQNPKGFARGRGELNDLARTGTSFLRDPIPNSGTAERNLLMGLLTGGGAGNVAGFAAGADPLLLAGATAAGIGTPRAVQAAYNLPPIQAYIRNQLMPGAGRPTGPVMVPIAAGQQLNALIAP